MPAIPAASKMRGKHSSEVPWIKPRMSTRRGIGKRVGVQPIDEAEHFFRCEACRGWIDVRDLGAALDYEGPLPHPTRDQLP